MEANEQFASNGSTTLFTLPTFDIENETRVVRSSLSPTIVAILDKTSVFFLPPSKLLSVPRNASAK